MHYEVLVHNLDVVLIVAEQLFDGRTDLLAVRSGKLEGFDNRYLGVLLSYVRSARDGYCVNVAGVGSGALRWLLLRWASCAAARLQLGFNVR